MSLFILYHYKLIMSKSHYSSDEECPVCFGAKYAEHASKLKCGHKICSECLANHAIASTHRKNQIVECPLCRTVVINIPPKYLNIQDDEQISQDYQNLKIFQFCLVILLILVLPYLIMKLIEDFVKLKKD